MPYVLLAFFSGGSSFARHVASSKNWIDKPACIKQCEVIETCAEKMNRGEQARTLCHVAACESGKFCAKKEVRSPTGKFHGPFQFSRGTWNTVCQPLFKEKKITTCSGKKSIYDACCTSMCASELIAAEINGGIKNWPQCGPAAQRSVASEKAQAKKGKGSDRKPGSSSSKAPKRN